MCVSSVCLCSKTSFNVRLMGRRSGLQNIRMEEQNGWNLVYINTYRLLYRCYYILYFLCHILYIYYVCIFIYLHYILFICHCCFYICILDAYKYLHIYIFTCIYKRNFVYIHFVWLFCGRPLGTRVKAHRSKTHQTVSKGQQEICGSVFGCFQK